jgi:ferric-dicitrate binding protein FerR (iron transport regulator)
MRLNNQLIEGEAIAWVLELHEPGAGSVNIVPRFLRWLDSSPRHLQAFAEAAELFDELGTIDPGRRIDMNALNRASSTTVVPLRPGVTSRDK